MSPFLISYFFNNKINLKSPIQELRSLKGWMHQIIEVYKYNPSDQRNCMSLFNIALILRKEGVWQDLLK